MQVTLSLEFEWSRDGEVLAQACTLNLFRTTTGFAI